MSTGKWTQPGVPHRGWTCVAMDDLEEPAHTCEMCEVQSVRFVHTMEHPDYPHTLDVGCICAGHMEENLVGARLRETGLRREQVQRRRWLTRSWRISSKGNEFINFRGFNVVVYPKASGIWGARVEDLQTGYARTSQHPYATPDRAKLAAYDAMLGMKARRED